MLNQEQIKRLYFDTKAELDAVTLRDGEIAFVAELDTFYKSNGSAVVPINSSLSFIVEDQIDFAAGGLGVFPSGTRFITTTSGTALGLTVSIGDIVEYNGSAWFKVTPEEGYIVFDKSEDTIFGFDGTEWKQIGGDGKVKALNDSSTSRYLFEALQLTPTSGLTKSNVGAGEFVGLDVNKATTIRTNGSADDLGIATEKAVADAILALPDEVIENAGALTGAVPSGSQVGVDTSTGALYYNNGGNWAAVPVSTIDLNTTTSDETGGNGTGNLVPASAPAGTPDIGDLHIEFFDDVILYFTAVAANWIAPSVTELDRNTFVLPDASDTIKGAVELATDAEVITGTDTTRAVTPAGLQAKLDDVIIDEDDMSSDSDTKLPTQQSVKSYVDSNDIQVIAAAPVDGTTVTYKVGQLFWDNVSRRLYESTQVTPSAFQEIVLGGEIVANKINSSGGSTDFVLDAATGTGKVVYFVNEDLTNEAKISVQPGENLGGVLDGEFVASSRPLNTLIIATDTSAGNWSISEAGAPSTMERVVTTLTTSAEVSFFSGASNLLHSIPGTIPPAGNVSANSLTYFDEGSFRYVDFELGMADDDGFILEFTNAVIPAGATVEEINTFGSDSDNSGAVRAAMNYLGANRFYINKDNSISGTIVNFRIVLGGVALGTTVLAGMVPVEDRDVVLSESDSSLGIGATTTLSGPGITTFADITSQFESLLFSMLTSTNEWRSVEIPLDRILTGGASNQARPAASSNGLFLFSDNTLTVTVSGATILRHRILGRKKQKNVINPQFAEVIDDDTFATATDANVASAESAKAYIDAQAKDRVHVGSTALGATDTANPTTGEVKVWNDGLGTPNFDTLLYYTGNDTDSDPTTHVFHVDKSGNITLLKTPGSAPERLHYASWAATNANSTVSLISSELNLTDTDFTEFDPDGLRTSGTELTIKQDGLYDISFGGMLTTNAGSNRIFLNGSSIAGGRISGSLGAQDYCEAEVIIGLTIGDVLTFRSSTNLLGPHITVRQLPTFSVALDAGVPVMDDDTFATATDTNVPTSEAVKAYVDSVQTHTYYRIERGGAFVSNVVPTALEVPNPVQNDLCFVFYGADNIGQLFEYNGAAWGSRGINYGFHQADSVRPGVVRLQDDDTFASANSTSTATSESIKTYVDNKEDVSITNGTLPAATGNRTVNMGGNVLTFAAATLNLNTITTNSDVNGLALVRDTVGGDVVGVDLSTIRTRAINAPAVSGATTAHYVNQIHIHYGTGEVFRASSKSTNPDTSAAGSVWESIGFLSVSNEITGQFIGSSVTFATLPTTDPNGDPVGNGDWAILTADDGGNNRGIYVHNGTSYVFAMDLADDLLVATDAEVQAATPEKLIDAARVTNDGSLSGNRDTHIPTEEAVKTYVDNFTELNTPDVVTNWNTTVSPGTYRGILTTSNQPSGFSPFSKGIVIAQSATNVSQIVIDSTTGSMATRSGSGAGPTWTAWQIVEANSNITEGTLVAATGNRTVDLGSNDLLMDNVADFDINTDQIDININGSNDRLVIGSTGFVLTSNLIDLSSEPGSAFSPTLRLREGDANGVNSIDLRAPHNLGLTYTIFLPNAAPLAGQVLRSVDGTNTEWARMKYEASFTTAAWTLSGSDRIYTVNAVTHGLGAGRKHVSVYEGNDLVSVPTECDAAGIVILRVPDGSQFNGNIVIS